MRGLNYISQGRVSMFTFWGAPGKCIAGAAMLNCLPTGCSLAIARVELHIRAVQIQRNLVVMTPVSTSELPRTMISKSLFRDVTRVEARLPSEKPQLPVCSVCVTADGPTGIRPTERHHTVKW